MHGTNKIRKLENGDGSRLQVREIFPTVQGEGPYSGMRAVFIRLTGCHLACTFCDTEWDDKNDSYLSVETIANAVAGAWYNNMEFRPNDHPLIVITGGEPTRQPLQALIHELDRRIPAAILQIETAGSFWQDILADPMVSVVVSPKTPFVHPKIEDVAHAYKYVIRATDIFHHEWGTPLGSTQEEGRQVCLAVPSKKISRENIYLSPCDEGDEKKNRANMATCVDLAMRYGYRVQCQLHKLAGAP